MKQYLQFQANCPNLFYYCSVVPVLNFIYTSQVFGEILKQKEVWTLLFFYSVLYTRSVCDAFK